MAKLILTTLSLLLCTGTAFAVRNELPPEVTEVKASDAYKRYWNAFESYEEKLRHEGEDAYRKAWDHLRLEFLKEKAKLDASQIAALQKSAAKYRKHLELNPEAHNRPHVMLNLAQILNLIADENSGDESSSGNLSRSEALAILGDIIERYPDFTHREQAAYLRAVVLESLSRSDEAEAAWLNLIKQKEKSIFVVHGKIALGDHYFKRDRAGDAATYYAAALSDLRSKKLSKERISGDETSELEKTRVAYRLAWAGYRAGEVDLVVRASEILLSPQNMPLPRESRIKMEDDAVKLLSDALYEHNNRAKTKQILSKRELSRAASKISYRIVGLLNSAGAYEEALDLTEFSIKKFPLEAATPLILSAGADAAIKLKKHEQFIALQEQIATILPNNSLWKAKHKDEPKIFTETETAARQAALMVAADYYDRGLAAGNSKYLSIADSHYGMLLRDSPNAEKSLEWRLRQAHCQFFMGNYDNAVAQYKMLKSDFKLSAETLEITSYQLVIALEKRWRESFGKALEKGDNPRKDEKTLHNLTALTQGIDEFTLRFVTQNRAVDLMLVGASALRDMNQLEEATRYWQSVLVSNSNPEQRSLALRGIIIASLAKDAPKEILDTAARFLRLEDWKVLGNPVRNELLGVLSRASFDEVARLTSLGKQGEAGDLATTTAQEFTQIPDREKLYREGAYLLALAGEWGKAEQASDLYLNEGLTQYADDMTYLKARAEEYQIKIGASAVSYLKLAMNFPKHNRATQSLTRAERLAMSEGDLDTAAKALILMGDRERNAKKRSDSYGKAIEIYAKIGKEEDALTLAKKRERLAESAFERYKARIAIIKLTYSAGRESEALDSLSILSKDLERSKAKLNQEDYQSLAGETHILIGDEARRKFEDFELAARNGSMSEKIQEKTRLFDDLASEYDKAAANGDEKSAVKARYLLATSAEAFANEISSLPNLTGEALTLKSQNRYQKAIDRLKELSRRYHTTNVLTGRKNPTSFRNNEWVRKSSNFLPQDLSQKPETKHLSVFPEPKSDLLFNEWSL